MSRKRFRRFMVDEDLGSNVKVGRLSDAEFRALVCGVWAIASKAEPRGAFMVGKTPATADDICFLSRGTSKRAATSLLTKLRAIGMLEADDELGGEWVHDWDLLNPAPKTDATGAERQARYRERMREQGISRHIPAETRRFVFTRDSERCVVCSATEQLELHHRTPVTEGGGHDPENLEVRCMSCHRGHAGHAAVTRDQRDASRRHHAGGDVSRHADMKVEVETPPTPQGEAIDFDHAKARLKADADAIERIWAAHVQARVSVFGKQSVPKLSRDRRDLIARRMKEWPEADLVDAVRGWRHFPHNRGENDRRTPYCDLKLLLRDAGQIERFRDAERAGGTGRDELNDWLGGSA